MVGWPYLRSSRQHWFNIGFGNLDKADVGERLGGFGQSWSATPVTPILEQSRQSQAHRAGHSEQGKLPYFSLFVELWKNTEITSQNLVIKLYCEFIYYVVLLSIPLGFTIATIQRDFDGHWLEAWDGGGSRNQWEVTFRRGRKSWKTRCGAIWSWQSSVTTTLVKNV